MIDWLNLLDEMLLLAVKNSIQVCYLCVVAVTHQSYQLLPPLLLIHLSLTICQKYRQDSW